MITICSDNYQITKPDIDSTMDIIIIDNISFDKLMHKNIIDLNLPEKCHNGMIYIITNKTPLQVKLSVYPGNVNISRIDGLKDIMINWGQTIQMTHYDNNWIIISKYSKNIFENSKKTQGLLGMGFTSFTP
jgi:hypothetical protein